MGLAQVARWNGQTQGPHIFSVAQHSLLVEKIGGALNARISNEERLFLLLHDAPEYVIGDMISPFKAVIGDAYKAVENRILSAILRRFSLQAEPEPALMLLCKKSDRAAAFFEAGVRSPACTARGRAHTRRPVSTGRCDEALASAPVEVVEQRYLERFCALEQNL